MRKVREIINLSTGVIYANGAVAAMSVAGGSKTAGLTSIINNRYGYYRGNYFEYADVVRSSGVSIEQYLEHKMEYHKSQLQAHGQGKRAVILSDGRRFESESECASHLGLAPSTICSAIIDKIPVGGVLIDYEYDDRRGSRVLTGNLLGCKAKKPKTKKTPVLLTHHYGCGSLKDEISEWNATQNRLTTFRDNYFRNHPTSY